MSAQISVTVDGRGIQLAFRKDDQETAVLLEPQTAQALFAALGQLLAKLNVEGDDDESEEFGSVLDVASPLVEVGTDEGGQAVMALQAGSLPPFMLRLSDDQARQIASGLTEILNAPTDARLSRGGH